MRRALLVVNPGAGRVTRDARDAALATLRRRLEVDVVQTKGPGHATEIARRAAEEVDLVVVLGGDGTANEAVNGLAGSPMPVGLLPGGGTNVFARSLGISRDVGAAAEALLRRLGGPGRRVPLGLVDGRYFLANCGVGFDAAIVRRVEGRRLRGKRPTDSLFVRSGLREFFFGFDRRRPHVSVWWGQGPGRSREDEVFTAIVQNTDPYTYLGSRAMRLCPEASVESGLHVFTIDTLRTLPALRVVLASFRTARPQRSRHVTCLPDLPLLEVRCDRPMPVQADGEYLGEREHVSIRSVPDALSVLA